MKKFLLSLFAAMVAMATFAQTSPRFVSYSFLSDIVRGGYTLSLTNAAAGGFTNTPVQFGGFTVTNAAAAPFGGFTNIGSWGYPGVVTSNSLRLTWTNNLGVWIIPTNATPGTYSNQVGTGAIKFVQTPEANDLTVDIPLWPSTTGFLPMNVLGMTNSDAGHVAANIDLNTIANATLSCRISGDTSAANTLNFIFIGLPDGVNEPTGTAPTFQWGVTAASGVTVISTNFPAWRFAGCGKLRLRSATLTTTAASAIGVTVQALNINGFVP